MSDAVAMPALSVRGLTKRFGDVLAADGLELDFYPGEVHAVLGENGAGKSTLMKMLYGYYRPDAGEVRLNGRAVQFESPSVARRHGIAMVFQNFTLVPALTVLENIALLDASRSLRLDRTALRAKIRSLGETYGLEVNPDAYVYDLSVGEQQRVEIVKLLSGDASVLIFDEPTSVLAPHEVDSLLGVLGRLRADGYTVILITHKMREVFGVADRITVLRRGRVVGGGPVGEFDEGSLVRLMLGDRADEIATDSFPPGQPGATGIALSNIAVRGADGRPALDGVSLEVRSGEVVGIAAVSGNGQAALADAILGIAPLLNGLVQLGDRDVTHWSTAARLRAGLAVIPEDLFALGVVPTMTVRENLALTAGARGDGDLLLSPGRLARTAAALASESPFTLPDGGRVVGGLSGGNAQRVVIAREVRAGCRFLVAYHPTRGLDVASTRAVQAMIADARGRGCAVLLITEDLDEMQTLADRIAVIYHGRVAGEFRRDAFDAMRIGRLMTGASAA
jgi:simple sugar transport system ATP-binding protein